MYLEMGGWFFEAYLVLMNFHAKAMNSIPKGTNSFANGTNSIAQARNSIAQTCKTVHWFKNSKTSFQKNIHNKASHTETNSDFNVFVLYLK